MKIRQLLSESWKEVLNRNATAKDVAILSIINVILKSLPHFDASKLNNDQLGYAQVFTDDIHKLMDVDIINIRM